MLTYTNEFANEAGTQQYLSAKDDSFNGNIFDLSIDILFFRVAVKSLNWHYSVSLSSSVRFMWVIRYKRPQKSTEGCQKSWASMTSPWYFP